MCVSLCVCVYDVVLFFCLCLFSFFLCVCVSVRFVLVGGRRKDIVHQSHVFAAQSEDDAEGTSAVSIIIDTGTREQRLLLGSYPTNRRNG